MPEGDTIYRAARTLHEALAGQTVTRFETVLPRLARIDDQTPIAGRIVERVSAAGKHILIDFSGGLHLRTHMRMSGSWHIYRAGERWKRPRRDMRLVIAAGKYVAVGFNIPVAEFLDGRALRRQDDLRRLGPDVLTPRFDRDEALRRIDAHAESEIGNLLLNQRVIAGIGNIFKSESLFLAGIDPFAKVAGIADSDLRRLIAIAVKLLRLSAADRRHDFWVYGRGGKPCRRCGTPIAYRKQGTDVRATYWCPKCQKG
ncbi:MAG TPA: DNA-formamidopyrimidine glycosylase family protein [Thermoanaerobaculia bacterium]|nr:DNA-formamidopyrimidine glycosylase family protein [Thermoanaerobaculia bacterium]